MKHRDLIIAAMDGKQFQVRLKGGLWSNWTLPTVFNHFHHIPNGKAEWEYRIKPEPVPDKVSYGTAGFATVTEASRDEWVETVRKVKFVPVKVITKTDENGVVTEHVEIVK